MSGLRRSRGRQDDDKNTMANSVIILPTLKDGVVALGDLWDCRSSSAVGNLFSKPLLKEHLEAHPISLLKYNLDRAGDAKDYVSEMFVSVELELECAGGQVKVKGKASFDREERQKFDQERLLCNYDLTTYEVRVRPNATTITGDKDKDVMSLEMQELIQNGELQATHYVQSVTLGGQAQASITFYENIDKTHMNLTGSLEGTIKIGPVTATAKASLELLDSKYSTSHNTQITVKAQPRLSSAPTTCKAMFAEVQKIDDVIEAEQHFKQLHTEGEGARKIYGVPLRFRLIPINRIIPTNPEDDTYRLLKKEILDAYSSMIATLEDYSYEDYLKQLLRDQVPSIIPILQDEFHPISQELASLSTKYIIIATALKKDAMQLYLDYKYGIVQELQLQEFLGRFSQEMPLPEIAAQIAEFGRRGRTELADIRASDVVHLVDGEGRPAVHFFTNVHDLEEWYNQERSIKILLKTGNQTPSSSSPNGIFQKLFKMSSPLTEIGVEVGVSFPSVSPQEFSLSLKTPGNEIILASEEMNFAIDLFRLATNTGGGEVLSCFISIIAELNSLAVPLKGVVLQEFPTFLNIMRSYLPLDGNVYVCETYCELLAKLGATLDTWNLVIPIEAVDRGVELMGTFIKARSELRRLRNVSWIFSRFNIIGKYSSPLLYAFRDDVLTAICYDPLDVSILLNCLNAKEGHSWDPISVSNARKSCLYIEQWAHASEIVPNCFLEQFTYLSEPLPSHASFPPNLDPYLAEALLILRPLAARKDNQVVTQVAHLALREFGRDLELLLVKYCTWADNQIGLQHWGDIDWVGFSAAVTALIRTTAPHLIMVYSTLEELKLLKEPFVPPDPEEPPETEDDEGDDELNEEMHLEIDRMIDFILQIPEEEDPLNPDGNPLHPLKVDVVEITRDTHPKWFDRRNKIVSLFEAYLINASSGSRFFYLFQLGQVADQISLQGSISLNPTPLAKAFIARVELDPTASPYPHTVFAQIQDYLAQGKLFSLLANLDSITVHPLLHIIHQELGMIHSIPGPIQAKSLLEKLIQFPANPEQLQIIWENPKFLYLIRSSLDNSGVIDTVFGLTFPHTDQDDDGLVRLPSYIPQDVGEKILPLFSRKISPCPPFPWEAEWGGEVSKFINQLKIFTARLSVPEEFMQVFMTNLVQPLTGDQLQTALKAKDSLFYWDDEKQLFTHSWTLVAVLEALSRLQDAKELKTTPTSFKNVLDYPAILPNNQNEQQEFLEVIEKWLLFVEGGRLPLFSHRGYSSITPTSEKPPKVSYGRLNQTSAVLIPYLLDSLKRKDSSVISPVAISSLIDYPLPGDIFGHINFGEGIPDKSIKLLFSKGDFLTAFLQLADPTTVHSILQHLSDHGHPLPLLINDISTHTEGSARFIWLLPALQCIYHPPSPLTRLTHLFAPSSFRFVLTLRGGNTKDTELGRSSLINRYLMRNEENAFGSLSEAGSQFGVPLSRQGTLEFLPLTEESCEQRFWEELKQLGPTNGQQDNHQLLLGVLHGNASGIHFSRKVLSHILPHVSAVLIFWRVGNWMGLQQRRKILASMLSPAVKVLDVILYPDPTIVDKIRDENLLYSIPSRPDHGINPPFPGGVDLANGAKLRRIVTEAFQNTIPTTTRDEIPEEPFQEVEIIPALPQSTAESTSLIALISEHSVTKMKTLLTSNDPNPVRITLIESFLAVLYLPAPDREIGIHHLTFELDHLNQSSSEGIRKKIALLRKHLSSPGYFPGEELATQIKVQLELLELSILSLQNLFYFTGLHVTQLGDISKFCQTLSECVLSGIPIQVEDIFQPDFLPILHQTLALLPANPRIFVVSALGLKKSGKSCLLNRLFGGGAATQFPEWSSSLGLLFKVLWIEDAQFRAELECDALLVLDSEGVGDPENGDDPLGQFLEMRLATFLLAGSDVTFLNVLGKEEISPRLESVFETALLQILTGFDKIDSDKTPIKKPDVLIVQQQLVDGNEPEMSESIANSLSKIGKLAEKYLFDLGITCIESERLVQLHSRSLQNTLQSSLPPSWQTGNENSYNSGIIQLRRWIEKKCIQSRNNYPGRITLRDWMTSSLEIWNSMPTPDDSLQIPPTNPLNAIDTALAADVANRTLSLKFAIAKSFSVHEQRLWPEFILALDSLFEEEFAPGFDAQVQILLNEVAEDLLKVINTCEEQQKTGDDTMSRAKSRSTRAGTVNPNSCIECQEAFSQREELLQELDPTTKSFLVKEDIISHTDFIRFQTYSKFQAAILSRSIQFRKSEHLAHTVEESSLQNPNNPEKIYTKFLQHLSTLQFNPKAKEQFYSELEQVYRGLRQQLVEGNGPFSSSHQFLDVNQNDLGNWPRINLLDDHLEQIPVYNDSPFYSQSSVVVPRASNRLRWDDATWLRNKLTDLPPAIWGELGGLGYRWGLAYRLYQRINEALDILAEKVGHPRTDFRLDFQWHVHNIGIQRCIQYLDEVQNSWQLANDAVLLMAKDKIIFIRDPLNYFNLVEEEEIN